MKEVESPTPGKGAGLVRGIVYSNATTAEASDKFQPATKASQSNLHRQRRKFTGLRRAFVLLRQVQDLARWRRAQGVVFDIREKSQFAWVLANLLVTTTPSFEERQRLNRLRDEDPKHGLDFFTLSRAMKDAWLGSLSEPEVMTIVQKVQDWHDEHPNCPISGEAVGKGLGLSAKERHEVGCWNILAIDESESQRAEQRKQRKREADRERARRKRKGKHVPRPEYLAQAERKRAFCQEHGISDRTLRRWIEKDDPRVRSLSHSDMSSKPRSDRLRTSVAKTPIHRQRSQNIGETMSVSLHTVSNEMLHPAAFHPADGANKQGFQVQQYSPVGIPPSLPSSSSCPVGSVGDAQQASPTPAADVATAYHAVACQAAPEYRKPVQMTFIGMLDDTTPELGAIADILAYESGIIPETVVPVMRDKRKRDGISQAKMARRLGVSQPHYANAERRRSGLSPKRAALFRQIVTGEVKVTSPS